MGVESLPRWLNPSQTAEYIGSRVDHLPRLLRTGKLPTPSYHLGPKSPRYDRLAIDEAFSGTRQKDDMATAVRNTVDALRREHRAKKARPTAGIA
jgi:hypothetical protein